MVGVFRAETQTIVRQRRPLVVSLESEVVQRGVVGHALLKLHTFFGDIGLDTL